ncbi:hypothetical protein GUJ93_ZPchr0012g20805 [Zizania palustris]|uniref:Uncharacterized protein n=1 Tax=Zizania palustris TaxID=103762 RepID=A0A8J5WJL8_ZIZPA|nr:hypothetical protein GUJ93_ZPchr0012g20805 [Zizania palustris]
MLQKRKKGPHDLEKNPIYSRFDRQIYNGVQRYAPQAKEHKENYDTHDSRRSHPDPYPRRSPLERFMDTSRLNSGSISPSQAGSSTVDMVLDKVSECEILWEDLVIDERIGLGTQLVMS